MRKLVSVAMVMMLLLVAPASAAVSIFPPGTDSEWSFTIIGQKIDLWNENGEIWLDTADEYFRSGYVKGYSDGYHGRGYSFPKITWLEFIYSWYSDVQKAKIYERMAASIIGYCQAEEHMRPLLPIPDVDLEPLIS